MGILDKVLGFSNYIMAALMAAAVALSVGWYTTHLKLTAEKNGRAADRGSYEAEQAKNKLASLQYKVDKEKEYATKATKADAKLADLRAEYRANILRYQAAQDGATPGPGVSSPEAGDPQGADRSGDGSLLYVTRKDANVCADNTARLKVAHDWAADLQK